MFWANEHLAQANEHLAQASGSRLSEKSWMDACCCSTRCLGDGNCC